jgi:ribonucleotide monophosphatase NagD (HAD superfamily)
MVGDRLETDILGAQQLGLRTALVLSGISTAQEAENYRPGPDIIAKNALEVIISLA